MNVCLKKKHAGIVFFCVLALCLYGCVLVHNDEDGVKADEREKLVLWTYYETEMQKESMDELVDGFNMSQEKYSLAWEYHGPVTEFNKRLAIAVTQNQLPDMVRVKIKVDFWAHFPKGL